MTNKHPLTIHTMDIGFILSLKIGFNSPLVSPYQGLDIEYMVSHPDTDTSRFDVTKVLKDTPSLEDAEKQHRVVKKMIASGAYLALNPHHSVAITNPYSYMVGCDDPNFYRADLR